MPRLPSSRLTGWMAVLVTGLAVASLWRTLNPPALSQAALHRSVGVRLAEEAATVAGTNGALVVITLERGQSDVVDAQVSAFQAHLKRWPGLRVLRTDDVDGRKGDKYGPGTGLSGRRLVRLAEKEPEATAFVSFLGVPDPEDLPTNGLWRGQARLVAFSRSAKDLAPLLKGGVVSRAVVPRFTFPAPGPETPRTEAEWFENRYQVVSAAHAK